MIQFWENQPADKVIADCDRRIAIRKEMLANDILHAHSRSSRYLADLAVELCIKRLTELNKIKAEAMKD